MTIRRDNVQADSVGPEKLVKSFREARYGFEPFSRSPHSWLAVGNGGTVSGYADPTGTGGNVIGLDTGYNTFVWTVIGTQGDAKLTPRLTTDGYYDFSLDNTLSDGFELLVGGDSLVTTGGNLPSHYTMGTDSGAFVRLKFKAINASGVDLVVGFRKVEAHQADFNSYDELAGLQVLGDSSSAAAAINAVNILNNAATNSDSTGDTLADATSVELAVFITGRVVTVTIDGAATSTEVDAFSFDDGEVVQPFIQFTQTTDLCTELSFQRLEWGLIEDYNDTTLGTP
jgi:hypothetical protein